MQKRIKILFLSLSTCCLVLCLICFWLYYSFYLRWADKFNGEGRYFDPEENVVYLSQDKALLPIAITVFALAFVFWFISRKYFKKKNPF
jgi:hypothetical protein